MSITGQPEGQHELPKNPFFTVDDDDDSPSRRAGTATKRGENGGARHTRPACDRCRARKYRCDGAKPACSHCESLALACLWSQQGAKRRAQYASLACNYCRTRNFRCDGAPTCATCASHGVSCQYMTRSNIPDFDVGPVNRGERAVEKRDPAKSTWFKSDTFTPFIPTPENEPSRILHQFDPVLEEASFFKDPVSTSFRDEPPLWAPARPCTAYHVAQCRESALAHTSVRIARNVVPVSTCHGLVAAHERYTRPQVPRDLFHRQRSHLPFPRRGADCSSYYHRLHRPQHEVCDPQSVRVHRTHPTLRALLRYALPFLDLKGTVDK
ncbi:hypothetical protein EXIGLDRAFT_749957 [Exidia glandulosa HHB12029]|uniref:Zn(2)-C6 fungal-type domain-containing protein n=1 Tax=Exidia glandulosa HHB12029 TaxID=1314781 RepID=A0A165HD84_EXIGL|nr:hypothetical protein EXIGLDRAFT_749957 [Exidia glandulosa HHB12029]